jgi:hypothetical protein
VDQVAEGWDELPEKVRGAVEQVRKVRAVTPAALSVRKDHRNDDRQVFRRFLSLQGFQPLAQFVLEYLQPGEPFRPAFVLDENVDFDLGFVAVREPERDDDVGKGAVEVVGI